MSPIRSAVRRAAVLLLPAICLLCLINASSLAQEPAEAKVVPPVPALDSVRWSGKPVNFEMLRGKTVVMLVYATWCPICNKWSGDLFNQLKAAIEGKPVVLMAINADAGPQGVQAYLTQRDFFAPNILHAYDPSMVEKLKLKGPLFNYALIGPDGKMQRTGNGGMFRPEGGAKKYSLPANISKDANLGSFELIPEDVSPEVAGVLWPLELGLAVDTDLTRVKKSLAEEHQEELKTVIDTHLDGRLKEIRELSEGEVTEKFEAVDLAKRTTIKFRSASQTRDIRKLLLELGRDKQFKKEMAAKTFYDRQIRMAEKAPARRQVYLQAVAKRFAGTHYGDLANEESKE